ncbi:AAA family ATPase [Trichormus sp. NMC-1]|uniref:ATP-binding protein n=1 Tax=Trichormus sp. NMC-1 TaxID=1853259 RepID=UPI0009F2DE7E|nr:AAA family ATPase [Trichormus sp. NMC-1]
MKSKKLDMKLFNFPKLVSSEQQQENEKFISELESLLQSYDFIPNGGIENIAVALIYNKKLTISNPIVYNDKLYCFTYYPKLVSEQQDLKNSVFRANLDLLLKKYKFFPQSGIERLNFVIVYNKSIDEIDIKGLKEEKNEEGLAFFYPIEPKYRMEQVILNEDLLSEINTTLLILKHKHLIYEQWGFNKIDPEPRAIINFYGEPGTGKTMTAHAIANELNCKILALNYAEVESKFVGDAPKNLVRAFETASKEKALLFFDEADSFLGKRITNVSSGSDQAINSLRSQMLILLDNFEGVVIFATNLIKNYDRAFESRIFKHLKFDLPNSENRTKILLKSIPLNVPFKNSIPLQNEDIQTLVEISDGFSGREIKNAILYSLIHAISENRDFVKFSDFDTSFRRLKEQKQELQQQYENKNSLDPERKRFLEEKIKSNLTVSNGV